MWKKEENKETHKDLKMKWNFKTSNVIVDNIIIFTSWYKH